LYSIQFMTLVNMSTEFVVYANVSS